MSLWGDDKKVRDNMTNKRQAVQALVAAFTTNKQDPTPDNLDALFDTIGTMDASEALVPVLEIAYEAIDKVVAATDATHDDVVADMRRLPSPA